MTRQYQFADVQRVTRIMTALVPDGVRINTTIQAGGYGLAITVCGANGCETYEFPPGITEAQLLRLAEMWKTGEAVQLPAGFDPQTHAGTARFIKTADELLAWVRGARKGERIVYFHGELAQARADMPKERVRLMSRADNLPAGKQLEPFERIKLQQIEDTLALLQAIGHLQESRIIETVQLRMLDNTGYTYFAARR